MIISSGSIRNMSKDKLPSLFQVKNWMRQLAAVHGIPEQLTDTWKHSTVIWHFADRIARYAMKNGYAVDRRFLKIACYIHDLGRMVTGGFASRTLRPAIFHLYEGYYFFMNKGYPKLARVCVSHVCGVGSTKALNKQYGFIAKNFFPKTIEEKIVAYVDSRTDPKKGVGPYVWPIDYPLKRFKKYTGVVPRLKAQHQFMQKITAGALL